MAIPYLHVHFTHARSDGGSPELLSYFVRGDILDIRLGVRFDFSHLSGDLVHREVILNGDVPDTFGDIEHLANCVDEAEVYRLRGDIDGRARPPQNGAAVVLALPPDSEITLSESIELTRRVVRSIAGDRRLAIPLAIHDPAMNLPGARNRHGHIFYPRRETENDEIAGPAIRDMFARPLQFAADGKTATVEGDRWPEFYCRKQQEYFAELAIDLVVDPIAPFPGRHWSKEIRPGDPRVQSERSRTGRLNTKLIYGNPVLLLGKLLRGRPTIRVAELQRLLDKFIDNESERRARLETILSGPDIETFAVDPAATQPRFVTTTAVRHSIQQACELVDRAALEPATGAIRTITASSHVEVLKHFAQLLGPIDYDRALLVGNNHSECRALSKVLKESKPSIATIRAALSESSEDIISNGRNATKGPKGRLIIVPRAESVADQTLAKLIVAADERGSPLVLLHDQSKQNGIANHRLAAYAVDRLTIMGEAAQEDHLAAIETYLRSCLIGSAVKLLVQYRPVEFENVDINKAELFDFVVSNDPRRVKELNNEIRSSRMRRGEIEAMELGHPLKPLSLSRGEWIVFTRDDYAVRPPVIRCGEIAQILDLDIGRNEIRVSLPGGGIETVKTGQFAQFRPAHALFVREARNVGPQHSLLIEVSDIHHVWAAILLAARHPRATLSINPRIAADIPSLIAATAASLPAALPYQLLSRRDPNAEIVAILNGTDKAAPLSISLEVEPMPEPVMPAYRAAGMAVQTTPAENSFEVEEFPQFTPPPKISSPPTAPLHEEIRAVINLNSHTRRGMSRLREKLSEDNPDRNINAEQILDLCGQDDPLAQIVNLLGKPRSTETARMAELDLPSEIEQLSPRGWSNWDLYRLRIDLSTLQWSFSRWELAPERLGMATADQEHEEQEAPRGERLTK